MLRLSALALVIALTGCANTLDRAMDRAENVAERAVNRNIDRRTDRAINGAIDGAFQGAENAVRCTYDDSACVERAQSRGDSVVLVDREGTPVDRNGTPVTEDNVEDAIIRSPAMTNVSANYDFVPGARTLFQDDFSGDNVGDFPRGLEFRNGTMEIIQTNTGRMLNAKTRGTFDIVLPETLPESFTIELDAQLNEFVNSFQIFPVDGDGGRLGTNVIRVDSYGGMGVGTTERGGIEALQRMRQYDQAPFALRVMVDGDYVKVYAGQERVANVPNANLGRSQRLRFNFDDVRGNPVYVGNIRVATDS